MRRRSSRSRIQAYRDAPPPPSAAEEQELLDAALRVKMGIGTPYDMQVIVGGSDYRREAAQAGRFAHSGRRS